MYKFIVVLLAMQVANVFSQYLINGRNLTSSEVMALFTNAIYGGNNSNLYDPFPSTNTNTSPTEPSGILSNGYAPEQPKGQINTEKGWPTVRLTPEQEMMQARNARYQFGFFINDGISLDYQQRYEARNNGLVKGAYSYDDGFVFRSVEYEADINGFRIIKEESSNSRMAKVPTGVARVVVSGNGNALDYNITQNELNEYRRRANLSPKAA